jgi:hypothetical protein
MDAAGLAPDERQAALDGLDRIGRWPGQRGPILRALASRLGRPQPGLRRLVEVGAGSGQLARWLAERLAARGHRVEVLPTDREAAPGVARLDAVAGTLPEADVYYSNLLLHHLEDGDAQAMLRRQASACRLGLLHFDLQRHPIHFYGARVILAAAGMPAIIRQDAASSIQQGFTRAELLALAAPLPGAGVHWQCPFRWMLAWRRS